MKSASLMVIVFATACRCLAQYPTAQSGQTPSADVKKDAKAKAVAEAKAKRDAQFFDNNATIISIFDRSGKVVGKLGERALYDVAVFSPDRTRVAIVKEDQANESADLFVLDVATGASTRITISAKTDFIQDSVWSPDGTKLAYVAMRGGQEGVYLRSANGQGPEEQLYKYPGAFLNLSDWSLDGRYLTFAMSDLSGGVLYILPLQGAPDRKPVEIFRSDLRMFWPRFSPDGRFLSYMTRNKAERREVFVRPVDSASSAGPWKISEGSLGPAFWRRDGKELYYVGLDRSMMVTETTTSPAFAFTKPKALFRPPGEVPDRIEYTSADGERFLSLPPAKGQQLQQITLYDREGKVVKKVGDPGLYSQPVFSPEATRLAVLKNDLSVMGFGGRRDILVVDVATAKTTPLTNDERLKLNPMWSPDGRYVLYIAESNGDWGVYRRAADGTGNEELLFHNEPGAFLSLTDISQDGNFLVCGSGGVVLLVPLTGSDPLGRKATEYLREEFEDNFGRLSPDGRLVAFQSDEVQPERGEVYVRPYNASTGASGEQKWRVSKDGAAGRWFTGGMLSWRKDGKELLFRGLDLDTNDLRVMAVDVDTNPAFRAGAPRLLFKLPGPLDDNLGNISRDGQLFVFAINVPAGYGGR